MSNVLLVFLRSYRVTFIIILGLAWLGVTTLLSLPREANPEVKIPFGAVVTAYPGASARDVEELITKPIETRLETLEGVAEITSTSRLGISNITVEFEADEDLDEAQRRLREAVDSVRDFPTEAEDPAVIELDFANEPILTITLGGNADTRLLSIWADQLSEDISKITGISDVTISGERQEEIAIRLNPHALTERNLSLSQVLAAIRVANGNAPFGQLETDAFAYDLRLESSFQNVGDIAAVTIPLPDGNVIPLQQIAEISLEIDETSTNARVSLDGQSAAPAVSLNVFKRTGGNIIDIVDEIEATIDDAQQNYLPQDIIIATFADRADEIRRSLSDVTVSGLQTLIIVFVVLWLFLGWQEAVITATAVPLTFFISFIIFDLYGITLNGISLFSLILSLGLLVDNSIVIIEGIHDRDPGVDLHSHAAKVVKTFQKPLIGGTLTTVAAFFPMLLVSGIIGEFLRTIPIVISATLLASLFVALALIPAVAVAILHKVKKPERREQRQFDRYFARFTVWYDRQLTRLLASRRAQNRFIAVMIILLVLGLSLPFTGLLKTALFPAVDLDFILINVELPPGTKQEQTAAFMADIEDVLYQVPEISSFNANIGSNTSFDLGGGSSSENLGSFFINLEPDRDRTSLAISNELRQHFNQPPLTRGIIEVQDISAGPPTAPPIEVRVIGQDLEQLNTTSLQIMATLRTIDGAIDIDRSLRFGAGEFTFTLNQEALAEHGLNNNDVTQFLRTAIFGLEATTFLDSHGDEISVQLEALPTTIASINDITALPLLTPRGQTITVGQVAEVKLQNSLDSIRRLNGQRTVTVTANAAQDFNPNTISTTLEEQLANENFPAGVTLQFGGEQEETVATFNELYQSMFISVILILLILVVEFNSYRQPAIIFLSIPLSLIGVLFGLLIANQALSFAAFIGLVSLTGIVVNDAIILVDRMNTLLKNSANDLQAVVRQGANSRLQPVILTTLTTAGGVAPLIVVDAFFRAMAVTIITGLMFASILTLIFIPVLYLRQQQKLAAKMAN